MANGKLTNEQLKQIVFKTLGARRAEVIVRSGVGEDTAALDLSGGLCVLSTDPITAATREAGRLSVLVSLNDVAASGAQPIAMLLTVLAPPGMPVEDIRRVMGDASAEAARHDIEIIGGHTEYTDAVTRLVLSVTMIGRADGAPLRAGGARAGDALIMTGTAGMEGAYVLLGETGAPMLDDGERAAIAGFGLSIADEARVAARNGATAMHDVTEGGVLGAAWEMGEAAGLGLTIDADAIPVHPATAKLCAALRCDALRLIGSGSLLIAHPDAPRLLAALHAEGIQATVIARFTGDGRHVVSARGVISALEPPASDELYRALGNARQQCHILPRETLL